DSYGGCNGDCLDPNGNDDACGPPPTCADQGYFSCTEVDDGSECTYDFWVCDGYADCSTGLDEADCVPESCEDQGLADCGDGQCIPTSYWCDGSNEWGNAGWGPDCANGADENFDDCCAAGSYADDLCNPPANCEDESACNYGAEGDCEYAATGTDCDGNVLDGYHVDCVGVVTSDSYLGWIGDGYCDDGSWGVNYQCCDYKMDNGDCGDAVGCDGVASDCGGAVNDDCGECGGDNSTCADCAGVANGDSFLDCADSCTAASYLSWIGDGYCDDGSWGVDFVSCGDFNCDDGDCGTELIDG
ncbi:uncharacterized protein METZ01_LOCUS375930, partial [marine metagenome]